MAQPRADPDIRNCWGHTFRWTDLHTSAEQMHPMMFTYDKLADECLQCLDVISPPKSAPRADAAKGPKRDLYTLLKEHANEDPKLGQLWTEINTVPEWVDWDQIKRGQEVFFRYGLPMLTVTELGFESLLGGMSAGRVVETLTRTGGFSANVVRRRLLETLQHVLQVSLSLESMKPGGEGHISSVRVRLLHASVRTRILSLVKQRPEYYNVEDLGIPISDLDCIATLHIFSTSVVWHGLPRQGIWLRDHEVADYLALWRLVAHYMGTPTESLESPATARAMMDSLAATQFNPTDAGKVLAQNIILGLENTAPAYASKEFMEALARHLIMPMLSDRLGLPHPNWYYRALTYGYCFLVMVICYGGRLFPMLDRSLIAFRRRIYYALITDKIVGLGGESLFEFKYVPFFTRTTKLGKRRPIQFRLYRVEILAQLGLLAALMTGVTLFWGTVAGVRVLL